MENKQATRMQMIRDKIDSLPKGSSSPSNHYWCVTCKKFFVLNSPECPYMTGMCVNTPIAVENLAPESTQALEKFGLFYPKIPQKLLSELITDQFRDTGRKLAFTYLEFLAEWKFDLANPQPLQTVKSFIILLSGCETAQRVNGESITFVLMDAGKIWEKEKLKAILEGSLEVLKEKLNMVRELHIDFIDILGEREVGRYYCAKCGMFFEFGMRREEVTCPLMSQKCMFDPQHIDKARYTPEAMLKQFEITPDLYSRFIRSSGFGGNFRNWLDELLKVWKITEKQEDIFKILNGSPKN